MKHESSMSRVVKLGFVIPHDSKQPSIQILNLDLSIPTRATPSKPNVTTLSQPPRSAPMNLLENEDLVLERF